MGIGVRGITFGALVIAAALTAGCSSSHGRDDAGLDGASPDDAAPDAPIDGGVRLASCARPTAEWTPTALDVGGAWRAIARSRDGGVTSIVASPEGGAPMRWMRFAAALPRPEIDASLELDGTEGLEPVATAADRFRIATLDRGGTLWVHDVTGGLLSRASVASFDPGGVAGLAIRDTRIGLVLRSATEIVTAEVRDVAGGPPIHEEVIGSATEAAIGQGRGLFAFVTDPGMYWGLDELGAIEAASLGVAMRRPTADGSTFAGVSLDSLTIRHPGGRLEPRRWPSARDFTSITLAVAPRGAVIAARLGSTAVALSLPDDTWLTVAELGIDVPVHADQGDARVGAFFLDGATLRWAGLSCAP